VNSTATQRKIRGESGTSISSEDVLSFGAEDRLTEDRLNHIATAACFKAEARGLSPGQELEDWLEAETESNDW
jgi:hypothetical protein